ncbi:MAG: hypothetical protein IPK65_14525 [Gammaproteobacteria bacterium]|nr:hypothetical protein [Gammaproteobacteria bacterium]
MPPHADSSSCLDPDVVFLNHGSYGATPRLVFEARQEWRLRLSGREPVQFINNEPPGLLRQARGEPGRHLNTDPMTSSMSRTPPSA